MLWVYGYCKYVYPFSAGINFRRQNLTSKVDPRTERVNVRGVMDTHPQRRPWNTRRGPPLAQCWASMAQHCANGGPPVRNVASPLIPTPLSGGSSQPVIIGGQLTQLIIRIRFQFTPNQPLLFTTRPCISTPDKNLLEIMCQLILIILRRCSWSGLSCMLTKVT